MSNAAERPAEKAAPKRAPIFIGDMIWETITEAQRIRSSQRAMVLACLRKEPYAPELRRADALEAAGNFLTEIRPYLKEVMAIIRPNKKSAKPKAVESLPAPDEGEE